MFSLHAFAILLQKCGNSVPTVLSDLNRPTLRFFNTQGIKWALERAEMIFGSTIYAQIVTKNDPQWEVESAPKSPWQNETYLLFLHCKLNLRRLPTLLLHDSSLQEGVFRGKTQGEGRKVTLAFFRPHSPSFPTPPSFLRLSSMSAC